MLFKVASRMVQRQARAGWRSSSAGKFEQAIRGGATGGIGRARNVGRLINMAKRNSGLELLSKLGEQGIEKYAQGGSKKYMDMAKGIALNAFFEALGPLGGFLKKMINASGSIKGVDSDIDAAIRFLRAMGYEVLPPPGRRSSSRSTKRAIKAAQDFLKDVLGDQPAKRGGRRRKKQDIDEIDEVDGMIDLGEDENIAGTQINMRSVQSSNVDAIGYDEQSWTCYIRFLGGSGKNRGGRGPTYAYYSVPPNVFNNIVQKSSTSPGGAVWDYLRVRGEGNFASHQFDYELVKLGAIRYVPRQATGGGLAPRTVETTGGKTLRSKLPGTRIFRGPRGGRKTARDIKRGQPRRGAPDRGLPNRGL